MQLLTQEDISAKSNMQITDRMYLIELTEIWCKSLRCHGPQPPS